MELNGYSPRIKVCWIVTATLGSFLCLLQLGSMMSLLAAHMGFHLVAPLTFAAALLVGLWLSQKERLSRKQRWVTLALVVAVVALSLAVSAFYYDLSWDGEWYHQTGIIHIASDWNPLTDPAHPFVSNLQLWVRHYPKGPWYQAAALYAATGHIELGKAVQWIALASALFSSLAGLREMGQRCVTALALAALIALNPVVMSELTGFMVDGIMVAFLTVAVMAMISALRCPRPSVLLSFVTASILTINAKFTGLVFLCIAISAVGLLCWFQQRHKMWRFTLVAIGTLALGVLVWGYNPYVTNTVYWHQPFYPMLGSAQYPSLARQGIDDVDRGETPKNIIPYNRFERFGYAIFGRPGNQPYFLGPNATLMWPFMAHRDDLYAYNYQETRVAGLGPLFSGSLILSLLLLMWLVLSRTLGRWTLALICVAILVSLLCDRHFWWARYGPQLWWLPIAPLILALQSSIPRAQRVLGCAVLCLLLLNAVIVTGIRMTWETTHSLALRNQLKQMRDSGKEYRVSTQYFGESARVRLGEAGIRYQDLGMKKVRGQQLVSVVEHYPAPIRYLPVDEK